MVSLSNMYQYLSNIPYIYLIYIPIFPIYLSNTCTIVVHALVFRSITPPHPLLLFLTIFFRAVYVYVHPLYTFDVRVFYSGFPSGSVTSERDTDTVTK